MPNDLLRVDFYALRNLISCYLDQATPSVFGTYLATEIMQPKKGFYYFTVAKFRDSFDPYSVTVFTFDGKKMRAFIDNIGADGDAGKIKGLVSAIEGTHYKGIISNFNLFKKDISEFY